MGQELIPQEGRRKGKRAEHRLGSVIAIEGN